MSDDGRMALEVVDGGLQSTIQDLGRYGYGALGLGRGGAADRTAFAVANLLAGNEPDAAAIEATIVPPVLRALDDVVIAVAGADLGLVVEASGRPIVPPAVVLLRAGEVLGAQPSTAVATGAVRSDGRAVVAGARAYIAPGGGIDVPLALGSRSTFLPAGFGGLEGRALRAGDRLHIGAARLPVVRDWPPEPWGSAPVGEVRVRHGPVRRHLARLTAGAWVVSPDSDRRGLRLVAPRGGAAVPSAAGIPVGPSHGVVPGTIQLSPDGTPLVLGPDAGPTGGYPVAAIVISADLDRLAQLRPGAAVRFRVVTLREARAAERARRAWLAGLASHLRTPSPHGPPDTWDELWRTAGG
jgi:biotin-dependent carboxylase-like uncharacterized protein